MTKFIDICFSSSYYKDTLVEIFLPDLTAQGGKCKDWKQNYKPKFIRRGKCRVGIKTTSRNLSEGVNIYLAFIKLPVRYFIITVYIYLKDVLYKA